MDSNCSLSQSIVILLFFSIWSIHKAYCTSIVDFGAISDSKTDSKQAILKAWKNACASNEGTLVIPSGTFLLSYVELVGPCVGRTKVVLNGTLIAPTLPTPNIDYWIRFNLLTNLSISGSGTLNGNGNSFWQLNNRTFITSLKLDNLKNAEVRSINSVNSKTFHMAVSNCQGFTISNVNIKAPADSPNTDGIHIQESDNVRISNVDIATGDDCISIGDGTTNMNITGVTCGPGHGISIGSLGKYAMEKEVRSITVRNCTLTNTLNGVRIKSFGPSPPGAVSTITFQGIIVNNVSNPIIIDQHYCPHSECPGGGQGESSVSINSVKFIDVRGSSTTAVGAKIDCSKLNPCKDIELKGVKLTFQGKPTSATCSSANVTFLDQNQIPSSCS